MGGAVPPLPQYASWRGAGGEHRGITTVQIRKVTKRSSVKLLYEMYPLGISIGCNGHAGPGFRGILQSPLTEHNHKIQWYTYESVSISSRTGRLEQELQMVQLSATRRNCITILWVSIVSFAAITLSASQQVFCCYFVIDSVPKLLDTLS
jgi:hypothetical protein